MADFTGVVNPKRVVEKRMKQAGELPDEPASAPKGNISQADFTQGRKRTPAEEAIRQKKLAEKLRQRDFQPSGY